MVYGWTIGNAENPVVTSNVDFIHDLSPYLRALDPYHSFGLEVYNSPGGVYDGQLLGIASTNGDAYVTRRSCYDAIDYVGVAHYDLYDGVARGPFNTAALLAQLSAQNPDGKPVLIEEYGTVQGDLVSGHMLTQSLNQVGCPAAGVQGCFVWDAHVRWNQPFTSGFYLVPRRVVDTLIGGNPPGR